MKRLCLLAVLILAARLLPAQPPEPAGHAPQPPTQPIQPGATGVVTGHVYLSDSHLPARMAYVTLLPVGGEDAVGAKPVVSRAEAQAGLDGSFVLRNVLPGPYYVVAVKPGYATPVPLSYLDSDDFANAPKDLKSVLAATFTPVLVSPNRTSTAEVILTRGAVISGTVRFDDGEPATEANVSILRKDKSGKWSQFETVQGLFGAGTQTDDQGNFRLTGLPPGEYLLRTTLALGGAHVSAPGMDATNEPDYRWDIYLGDGIRPRDARTITLKEGEESQGNTIEIPLARLHSISGTILSLETGAPIPHAEIELHTSDDDSTCTTTSINSATGQFHLPYVVEGEYTLKVTNASDAVPGNGKSREAKPGRTYADASQLLIVKGETNGITITVKPQPGAAAITTTQQQTSFHP